MTARGLGDDPLTQPRRPRVPSPIPSRAELTAGDQTTETAQDPAEQSAGGPRTRKNTGWKAIPKDKRQLSLYLRFELIERMRDTVWAVQFSDGAPDNLSDLASIAIEQELADLEKKFNEGRRFPRRPAGARIGHPL